jgi:broad specificity phosphatase PhoE
MPRFKALSITLIMFLSLGAIAGLQNAPQPTKSTRDNQSPAAQQITTDVIYVIRHADTLEGNNPDLSPAGLTRVQSLNNILQSEQLAAVYITNTARSIQTGTPLALAHGISTTVYNPFDAEGVAGAINAIPGSNAALVVAHSNTVPMIITAFGGPHFEDLEETEFDRLFAVTLSNGKHVRTLELHYE